VTDDLFAIRIGCFGAFHLTRLGVIGHSWLNRPTISSLLSADMSDLVVW